MQFNSNFNKTPHIDVKDPKDACASGWKAIARQLKSFLGQSSGPRRLIVVETYQGVHYESLSKEIQKLMEADLFIDTSTMLFDESRIREIIQPDLTDDRVFGYMSRLRMENLIDHGKMKIFRKSIEESASTVLVYGYGASILCPDPDLFIYADMARWEIQMRMRAGEVDNIGVQNRSEGIEKQYKHGYFVDWRICDRLKKASFPAWNFVLDTTKGDEPKMLSAESFREGLRQAVNRPFSVVPFFDPGPWGGQWMKDTFSLDREPDNYAWCFNCVPEENSLLLKYGDCLFETPSINLVFFRSRELLGDPVHARFGDEFPIRFDYLDTMEGGNLSLQVHPLTEYIQDTFGMNYTQDESYYMLDAGEDASVYLGLKKGIDPSAMADELRQAEASGQTFDVLKHVENWPAKKHDHFLIPGGTVHCSGKNGMVLEISATPYIFTFKLYDWGRVNLDGKPRPINIEHGLKNIQWERSTEWTKKNLINRIEKTGEGEGWTEEKTGLHEREFIETRRHWFSKSVEHHTGGGVNVFTLVEGDEIVVESPDASFDPFIIRYAETFIVPAAVEKYTIRPHGPSEGKKCATIKAFVRVNP